MYMARYSMRYRKVVGTVDTVVTDTFEDFAVLASVVVDKSEDLAVLASVVAGTSEDLAVLASDRAVADNTEEEDMVPAVSDKAAAVFLHLVCPLHGRETERPR